MRPMSVDGFWTVKVLVNRPREVADRDCPEEPQPEHAALLPLLADPPRRSPGGERRLDRLRPGAIRLIAIEGVGVV